VAGGRVRDHETKRKRNQNETKRKEKKETTAPPSEPQNASFRLPGNLIERARFLWQLKLKLRQLKMTSILGQLISQQWEGVMVLVMGMGRSERKASRRDTHFIDSLFFCVLLGIGNGIK